MELCKKPQFVKNHLYNYFHSLWLIVRLLNCCFTKCKDNNQTILTIKPLAQIV